MAKKRMRIGSDEYTIQLEARVNTLEISMKDFVVLVEKLKEKDDRIAELEAQLKMKCNCESPADTTVNVTEDHEPSPDFVKKDVLIIGDSIADSLDPEFLDPASDTTVHAVHGGMPLDILETFRKRFSKTTKFKRILVHFGSNMVPKFSPGYVADNIIECLLSRKRLAGVQSSVVYSSILPKLDDCLLPGIRFVNDRVIHAGKVGPPSV